MTQARSSGSNPRTCFACLNIGNVPSFRRGIPHPLKVDGNGGLDSPVGFANNRLPVRKEKRKGEKGTFYFSEHFSKQAEAENQNVPFLFPPGWQPPVRKTPASPKRSTCTPAKSRTAPSPRRSAWSFRNSARKLRRPEKVAARKRDRNRSTDFLSTILIEFGS